MSATVVSGGLLVAPDGIVAGHDVVVRAGVIEDLPPAGRARGRVVDARGGYVLPGLVDLHAHGAAGSTFNEPSAPTWRKVAEAHLLAGTTSMLATLATDEVDRMVAALAAGREAVAAEGTPLVGVHLEGPYLAAGHRGAHPAELLREPDDGSWPAFLPFTDLVRLVSLAPELPGADALIERCAAEGIVVAAGHSGAGPEQLRAAAARGLSHVTHLWSGQSTLRKDGPWRVPGLLEAALGSDGLTAEVIADGRHLTPELVRIAYRCLGPDRLCLVSDASAGAGLPPGETFAMGGITGVVGHGVALTEDGGSFCGSTSFLLDTVRFAVRAGVSVVDAVRMASTTPAAVLGLSGDRGALRSGAVADIVVTDPDLRPYAVMKAGAWVGDHD